MMFPQLQCVSRSADEILDHSDFKTAQKKDIKLKEMVNS